MSGSCQGVSGACQGRVRAVSGACQGRVRGVSGPCQGRVRPCQGRVRAVSRACQGRVRAVSGPRQGVSGPRHAQARVGGRGWACGGVGVWEFGTGPRPVYGGSEVGVQDLSWLRRPPLLQGGASKVQGFWFPPDPCYLGLRVI